MQLCFHKMLRAAVLTTLTTATLITSAFATSAYKTTAMVYLRQRPSVSSNTVKIVKSGAKVQSIRTSKDGDWVKVTYGSKEGYIYKKFLRQVTTPTIETDGTISAPTGTSALIPSSNLRSDSLSGTNLGQFKLTFYCGCTICSEQWGTQTATGTTAQEGRTIAVDPTVIPYGSKVHIDGFGDFIAEDCGGAIKGNHIDIYVADHDRCNALGVQYANVTVN